MVWNTCFRLACARKILPACSISQRSCRLPWPDRVTRYDSTCFQAIPERSPANSSSLGQSSSMTEFTAGRLASSNRSASGCMKSGKRMGKESICVLAMCFLKRRSQHLFGAGQERLLLVGSHAVQSTRKRSEEGEQITSKVGFWSFCLIRLQDGDGRAKGFKEEIKVGLSEASQTIRVSDGDFGHFIADHESKETLKLFPCRRDPTADILQNQHSSMRTFGFCPGLKPFHLTSEIGFLPMPADAPIEDKQTIIRFAQEAFDFSTRNARFQPNAKRLDLALFDPASDGERMQAQLSCRCVNAQHLGSLCPF